MYRYIFFLSTKCYNTGLAPANIKQYKTDSSQYPTIPDWPGHIPNNTRLTPSNTKQNQTGPANTKQYQTAPATHYTRLTKAITKQYQTDPSQYKIIPDWPQPIPNNTRPRAQSVPRTGPWPVYQESKV